VRVAQDLFKQYLPANVLPYMNLETLTLSPNSFVGNQLKTYLADIVYEIQMNEQPGYLSIIVEHKSRPDRWLPLQLQLYIIEAMMQHHKQHPNEDKVPLIYGLVLYHGKQPYPFSLDIRSLLKGSDALIDKCFNKPPQLLDLTQIDNKRLKSHLWSGALLLSLKNIFEHDLLSFMEKNMSTIFQQLIAADGEPLVRNVLEYYVSKGTITNSEQFSNYVAQQISKEMGEDMATLAEQWLSEGEERGIKKSAHRIARNLLARGLRPEIIAQDSGLPVSVVLELKAEIQGVS